MQASLYHLRDAAMRLTLVREHLQSDVFTAFAHLLDEVENNDSPETLVWAYHDFASNVLSLDDDIITGDRWKDHILSIALESETTFTNSALHGKPDEVLLRAQMRDLSALRQLFSISDETIIEWIDQKHHIDARSWIRWSPPAGTEPDYGKGPLSTMRELLAQAQDWSVCAQPLWDFFHTHGTGSLLRSNRFWLEDRLYTLQRLTAKKLELDDIWPEYSKLASTIDQLLCDCPTDHIALVAEDGQKFAVQSLLALDERVRMIEVTADGIWASRLGLSLQEMGHLPGANLLYIDLRGQDLSVLRQLPRMQGSVLIAALEEAPEPVAYTGITTLHMPVLPEMAFSKLVEQFIYTDQEDREISPEHMEAVLKRYSDQKRSIETAHRAAEEILKSCKESA